MDKKELKFHPEVSVVMRTAHDLPKSGAIGNPTPILQTTFRGKNGVAGDQNPCGQNNMGGAKYNPVSEAGVDDAADPAVVAGKQIYKHLTATGKNPVPANFGMLGLGTAGGIAAESGTRYLLDATRGGKRSENPYVDSLEKLGSRMVGGATTGAIAGRLNPYAIAYGAVGGAAIDTAENIYGIATAIPEMMQLKKEADLQLQKDRAATAKTVWENLQKEQRKRDANY